MSRRPKTSTKLRSVDVPRTTNGWMADEYGPGKISIMSARKSLKINPEEGRISERCHHGINKYDKNLQKADVETRAGFTVQNFSTLKPQKQQKGQPQTNFYGRKLQYPHAKQVNLRPQTADKAGQKRSQSVDFSSKHFVDRSARSNKIANQKVSFQQKFQKAFEYLVGTNKLYMNERSRICNQRARPKEEIFQIQMAKTSSTYQNDYPGKDAPYQLHMEPQNEKHSFCLPEGKVVGNSLNHEAHNGRQGPKADLQKWPEGFRLQGPLDSTSTYANNFPDHGGFDKMVPVAFFNQHPMGMAHLTNSTNRTHFKGEQGKQVSTMTWNNQHPFGNDFDPNRKTQYSDNHNLKDQPPIQQWPMDEPRLLVSDGKFTTEYRSNLDNQYSHQLNRNNYCGCQGSTISKKLH